MTATLRVLAQNWNRFQIGVTQKVFYVWARAYIRSGKASRKRRPKQRGQTAPRSACFRVVSRLNAMAGGEPQQVSRRDTPS
jgi:hypothetical protein